MEQIILNLVPGGVSPVCYVSQYDVGRKIRLHLRNGSDPYVLSGAETVTATIRKVSGEELIYDIANTSASYVDLIVNYDATDVIGESVCELIITESGTRLGSANFKMRVDQDVYSGDQKLEVVTASSPNSLLSFETNIDENLLELKMTLEPKQDLHGYPSPWIDSNVINKEPYIKRAVAGTASRIGNHLYDKLVGGTVAFNQLIGSNMRPSQTQGGVTYTKNNDGTFTLNGTAEQDDYWVCAPYPNNILSIGHKYYLFEANNSGVANKYGIGWRNAPTTILVNPTIINCTDASDAFMYIYKNGAVINNVTFRPQLIDLTQMFGSTIADYIYGLEQATAGAGVAFFRTLFPNDYYDYNAGELMSVKATAHVMKNASNQVIGNYALDSNLELRGLFKLDANNKLYADGDTYESSGLVTRNYPTVNLGGLDWTKSSSTAGVFFATVQNMKQPVDDAGRLTGILCLGYPVSLTAGINDNMTDKSCLRQGGRIFIRDLSFENETASTFKSSVNGKYLVYEAETPTTEQASPFTNPQVCDENGTEEYTDNRAVAIPVGHETYQANICPIEGYTEANITRCGVNLWDEETESGSINSLGQDTLSGTQIRTVGYVSVKPSTTYYLKTPKNIGLFYYDASKTLISSALGTANTTFTTPSNCAFMRWYFIPDYGTTYNNDTSINYPSTDTTYHPYNGQTYTIAFGQTVYGGVLDVTRGKLRVTFIKDTKAVSEYSSKTNIGVYDQYGFNDFASSVPKSVSIDTQKCNIAEYTYNFSDSLHFFLLTDKRLFIFLPQDVDTSLTIEVCYELATPFDIDLTPEQISALVGENNILSNANGGTEVKFFRMISAS